MTIISDFDKMQELITKNRILAKNMLAYCKYDIPQSEEIKSIILALEITLKNQDKIEKLMESSLKN